MQKISSITIQILTFIIANVQTPFLPNGTVPENESDDQSQACIHGQQSIHFLHDVIAECHYYIARFFTIKISIYIHISVVSCCVDNYIEAYYPKV
jgi:hypothetical protein